MLIAVVGAGAIGSSVGGLLARAGEDVILVGRGEHVHALRTAGLRVDGVLGTFTVPVQATTDLQSQPDLALLTVKTQDLASAIEGHRELLAGTPVVTIQNGVRSEEISRRLLPTSPLVGGVITMTANYLEPGHVTIVQQGNLVVGAPTGPSTRLVRNTRILMEKALPTTETDNLPGVRWTKVLVNLNNALPALVNEPLSRIAGDAYLGRLALALMREGYRIGRRAGLPLEDLPSIPVRTIRLATALPSAVGVRSYARRVQSMSGAWDILGSTLQSLRRHRPTEIDYLNGEIVALGRRVGRPARLNEKVVQLVHRVEATGRFLDRTTLEREMISVGWHGR